MYYVPSLFDEAGLNYPPDAYGQSYRMPNGTQAVWSWQTVGQVAKLLTLDVNGQDATSPGFDSNHIVQYGYSPVWENHPSYIGSFWGAGSIYRGQAGAYSASIPDAWKAAWQWYYDGIWGDQPFIPDGAAGGSPELASGNTFASGRIAMTVNPSWYLCCLQDLVNAGYHFQFAPLPSYQGQVHGRVDADTFRIWKGTSHPAEAFEVLSYLVGPEAVEPLIVGSNGRPAAYGAISALSQFQANYTNSEAYIYPFVDSWDLLLAGLNYPDVPSAEGYAPNFQEAWGRLQTFGDLMGYSDNLDLSAEIHSVEQDLRSIFNR
jgi:multiple sugar transport system substrate-binding protein